MLPRLVTLAAITAGLAAAAPAASASPQPGDIIAARPYTANIFPGIAMRARAWKITYRSTSAKGDPVDVTGTVLVPHIGAGPRRPLIGYAIGSQGLADRCAASTQLAAGSEYEAALIQMVLSRGWAVALTDYPGLGTPGDHPYVVGKANGPAVLDAMRAARRLPAAGLPSDGPLALFGYSEGGGATGAAAEQQPSYAPDLPLEGAAVGGVVANFEQSMAHLEGSPVAFLLMYAAIGFNAAYPELHLEDALNARGRAYAARLRNTCLVEAIPTALFAHSTDFFTQKINDRPDFLARLRENDLGATRPQTPVFLSHSPGDEALPYGAASELYGKWCARGANVEFKKLLLPEHLLSAVESAPQAVNWLADRFAGKPTRGCNAAP